MEFGLDPESFWSLTPREIAIRIDGAVRRLQREARERASHAWHIAALSRAKKLPKLKDMLAPKSEGKKPRPWQEMLAIAKAWDARLNPKTRV